MITFSLRSETESLLTCCQLCARVVCKAQGGAAWQTETEEVGEEGSQRGGGRALGEEMEEGEGEGGEAPITLLGARSEA